MKAIIAIAILALFPAVALSQSTYYVPDDFSTIQDAIDASANGDTIIVRAGTYGENIDFKGKAITLKSSDGSNVTVIDGKKSGSVVTFTSNNGQDTLIDGFTITNGSAQYGGGIYCQDYSSPIIQNCIISDNTSSARGGGIYCDKCNPIIRYNTIEFNTVTGGYGRNGGGICCNGSAPTIKYCNISGNVASGHGGGLFAADGNPTISHCTIDGNWAQNSGGGLWNSSSPEVNGCIFSNNSCVNDGGAIHNHNNNGSTTYPSITNSMFISNSTVCGGAVVNDNSNPNFSNCLFFNNQASKEGGGICGWYGSKVKLVNCTFLKNSASSGGALFCDNGDTLINCILWGDSPNEISFYIKPTVTYSCIQGGWSGTGNISVDPLFVDPALGDFHLTCLSPCKDTGDNTAVTELYDFEGDPRIAYGTVDMGADEFYTHLYWTGDATPGGNVEVKFVGLPGTMPVQLWLGSGVMDPPMPSIWGDWYLAFPIIGPIDLGKIPSPNGALIIPGTIPGSPPPPYSIPMQALIGAELTNLSVLEVK